MQPVQSYIAEPKKIRRVRPVSRKNWAGLNVGRRRCSDGAATPGPTGISETPLQPLARPFAVIWQKTLRNGIEVVQNDAQICGTVMPVKAPRILRGERQSRSWYTRNRGSSRTHIALHRRAIGVKMAAPTCPQARALSWISGSSQPMLGRARLLRAQALPAGLFRGKSSAERTYGGPRRQLALWRSWRVGVDQTPA